VFFVLFVCCVIVVPLPPGENPFAVNNNNNECGRRRMLVGTPEGKRPLGRPRRMWVDNIKMDLRETEWDGMNWIDLVQDRDQWRALVNKVMSPRVP
jgi:hypothetical protein